MLTPIHERRILGELVSYRNRVTDRTENDERYSSVKAVKRKPLRRASLELLCGAEPSWRTVESNGGRR